VVIEFQQQFLHVSLSECGVQAMVGFEAKAELDPKRERRPTKEGWGTRTEGNSGLNSGE
jgi:hypothetical protein